MFWLSLAFASGGPIHTTRHLTDEACQVLGSTVSPRSPLRFVYEVTSSTTSPGKVYPYREVLQPEEIRLRREGCGPEPGAWRTSETAAYDADPAEELWAALQENRFAGHPAAWRAYYDVQMAQGGYASAHFAATMLCEGKGPFERAGCLEMALEAAEPTRAPCGDLAMVNEPVCSEQVLLDQGAQTARQLLELLPSHAGARAYLDALP